MKNVFIRESEKKDKGRQNSHLLVEKLGQSQVQGLLSMGGRDLTTLSHHLLQETT